MSTPIASDIDLSALFDIDLNTGGDPLAPTGVLCARCKGRGTFLSYTGRAVGRCHTCDGTGLSRTACVTLSPGDCVKCAGSGEWSRGRACFACDGAGKEKPTAAIDVGAIEVAFAAARANKIKSPKLRLADFVFSRAPDHGANAGSIYVKSKITDAYLGKVTAGRFIASRECDDPTKTAVIAAAADPHSSAKAYGLRTGSCACCGRELTNGESIELGIGPICRDKFGWGG
jgi:hypothetical protein